MTNIVKSKIIRATKWSAVTEVLAKLVTPLTSIVLARVLTPEAFGIVATVTMVISFAEIFTDAGFQRYLIQHEFLDDTDKSQCIDVAFWTNLFISIFLWGIIALFQDSLAYVVGNPGLGYVIVIACISIPLAAFSSIQAALFKRDLDFKALFFVRIVGVCIPLFITIPLALIFRNFWAIIIGTIAINLSNAIILTLKSKWKPKLFYSFVKLRQMLSFSIWSIVESVSIWLTGYVDIFIVGVVLNSFYLGIYKTSMATVGGILGLITAAVTPVLFSSLSRLQNDDNELKRIFLMFQKVVGIIVIPTGVGIYVYKDFVTSVLLGKQWGEAVDFIGLWALVGIFVIVLSNFCSEVYRAKGKPKISVLSQIVYMTFTIPALLISIKYGFSSLYHTRSYIRLVAIIIDMVLMYILVRMSPWKMIMNILPSLISAIFMGCVAWGLHLLSNSIWWTIMSIIICIVLYTCTMCLFSAERYLVITLKNMLIKNLVKRE